MKDKMTSKERITAVINRGEVDYVPLYCWVFGVHPPSELRWTKSGKDVPYWYTMRLEHIHTLPYAWDLSDDFNRVRAFLSLGVDDIIDVSVPWAISPEVGITDWREDNYICRMYDTPAGQIVQKVRAIENVFPQGQPVQPDKPALFDDLNLPLSVSFPFKEKSDIAKIKYLFKSPTERQLKDYKSKISMIKRFAKANGVFVQGWPIFGIDGIIWAMGLDKAVMSAAMDPEFFQEVVDTIYEFDMMRLKIMLETGGVDMVVQRGWFGSTSFLSPNLFRKFILPNLKKFSGMVHQAGLKFGYAMNTGVMKLMEELVDAEIDLLYFIDPEQDIRDLKEFKSAWRERFAVAGGINSGIVLAEGTPQTIRSTVSRIIRTVGSKGFILSPVDALFPETPWRNVQIMIDAWKKAR